jgi:DNA-binding NarL/FixJ family response regulator
VVLADDDVLLREGLASLLDRSEFEVVGQCGDGSELTAMVRAHRPDLAIVDSAGGGVERIHQLDRRTGIQSGSRRPPSASMPAACSAAR